MKYVGSVIDYFYGYYPLKGLDGLTDLEFVNQLGCWESQHNKRRVYQDEIDLFKCGGNNERQN